ncbi:hypothetical protein GGF38_002291, partial [Coemansia sp. RSA 25]
MLSSARSLSKQVLSHRTQIQQQTKSQLRNQHNGPRPKDQQQQQQQQQQAQSQDAGISRFDDDSQQQQRQGVLDKMRLENRERKKRWREMNDERNKDNDLRCRVNKRANQLYGAHPSADKERWVGEEFERRQQRRRHKETRKRSQEAEEEEEGVEEVEDVVMPLLTHSQDAPVVAGTLTARMDDEVGIPTGFGSYATLPTHQVRAAYDFWKNVAGHHALEATAAAAATTADPAGAAAARRRLPVLLTSAAQRPRSDAPTLVAPSPASMSPPAELRQPLVRRPAPSSSSSSSSAMRLQPLLVPPGNHNGHVAAESAQGTYDAPPPARHMRPWEEEAEEEIRCSDQPMSELDGYSSRSATATSPSLPGSHLYYWGDAQKNHYCYGGQRDDVAAGLSEAAFSLMSLSSSWCSAAAAAAS